MSTSAPLRPALRDPTANAALRNLCDRHQPTGRRVVQRYDAGVEKIRRGRLEVTIGDAVFRPLKWQGEATG